MAKLRECISASTAKKCGNESFPILSITMKDGIVLQSDKFKKRIASADTSTYICVPYGKLVQGIHIDEGNFGVQDIVPMGIVSPAYKLWDINEDVVLPKYIEMVLRSPKCIEYYKVKLTGTVNRRGRMSATDFLDMDIPLPNKEKQYQIVENMNKLNQLITMRKEQLAKLDQLVKSRFIELFECKGFPNATIGELVASKVSPVKKVFSSSGTIKYIDISSIDNKRNIMTGFTEYVLEDAPSRAQQHIRKGDIVVSTVRPNLKNVAITGYDYDNLVASSGFCVLRAEKCLPSYLMAVVCSDDFTDAMTRVVTGANYPAIKDSDVRNYVAPNPPIELQEQFATFVEQTDKSKLVIQQSLDKLELLKKSLMQEYFG